MSEGDGSEMERLLHWISRSTQNRLKMASFKFRLVLCRIRLFPILILKIRWLGTELLLHYCCNINRHPRPSPTPMSPSEFEHLTAEKRGILEHYKYDEIKKFNPAFVCEKLKELYDVHVGRSQVALYMSRTSWLKYNAEKKCYEVSFIFEVTFLFHQSIWRLN